MNDLVDNILRDWCDSLYRTCLRALRSSQYLVLAIGVGMIFGGAMVMVLPKGVGWVVSLGGLVVVGLNLGTWNLVRKSTELPPDD